jgi:hypothetical protein
MLAETAEQLGLDGVERIRPLQAHDLADPFRADQLRDVVMSRFERHLADDPLFVVIVDLIDSARLLPDTRGYCLGRPLVRPPKKLNRINIFEPAHVGALSHPITL